MKKIFFFTILAIFSLSTAPAFATEDPANATENATETKSKLSEEEVTYYKARVKEIRNMDKSELTSSEKKELKSELKDIKETMRKNGPVVYIGGSTLLLIIILILIL